MTMACTPFDTYSRYTIWLYYINLGEVALQAQLSYFNNFTNRRHQTLSTDLVYFHVVLTAGIKTQVFNLTLCNKMGNFLKIIGSLTAVFGYFNR